MSAWERLGFPLVIGHRGASAYAPENTLSAFERAVALGADGVELDAKLTADGQIVVIHDQTLERTTNGAGKVRQKTLAELRGLDAGSWFGAAFAGELIPTLEQVLETVGGKILVDIELTNYATPFDPLPERAAELVRRMGLQDRVIFTSFFPTNLYRARCVLPQVAAGQLAWVGRLGALTRGWLGRQVAPRWSVPYYTDLSAAYIRQQHLRNRRVIAWTVNQPEDAARLLAWGVDGIITDDPVMIGEVIRRA